MRCSDSTGIVAAEVLYGPFGSDDEAQAFLERADASGLYRYSTVRELVPPEQLPSSSSLFSKAVRSIQNGIGEMTGRLEKRVRQLGDR